MRNQDARIGDKLWLNQGDIPACEILDIHLESTNGMPMAFLRVKGWQGLHWYPISKLEKLHPVTNKAAEL